MIQHTRSWLCRTAESKDRLMGELGATLGRSNVMDYSVTSKRQMLPPWHHIVTLSATGSDSAIKAMRQQISSDHA